MSGGRDYDERRLAELALYVAQRSAHDPRFGAVKLNKVLFFSDFESYRRTGQSITGAVYQNLPQGPCPQQLLPALDSLDSDVGWVRENTYAGTQKRLVARRDADLSMFDGDEIALVDEMIDELRPLTNKSASELSHETMAWRLTSERQEIPYGAALLSKEPLGLDDFAWLEGVAGESVGAAAP